MKQSSKPSAKAPLLRFIPSAETVASAFCEVLAKWLGREKIALVIARNATPAYAGACASHDFCDANVAMDKAFQMAAGYSTSATGGEDIGCMSDAVCTVWQEAWELARNANFALPRLGYVVTVKLEGMRAKRLHVAGVNEAKRAVKAMLPAVIEHPPVVKTRGGQVVVIFQII